MTPLKEYKHDTPMTSNTTWTGCIPPGYELEKVVFLEASGSSPTLDLGTSAGAHDVFSQREMEASDVTNIVVNKIFSMSTRKTLYLSDAGAGTWNGGSLTAKLLLREALL